MKHVYISQILEVFEYKVERGFAQSAHTEPIYFIGDVSLDNEEITEGDDYSLWGEDIWY